MLATNVISDFSLENLPETLTLRHVMNRLYIPRSSKDADEQMRQCDGTPLEKLDGESFVRAWFSISYLNPGLHPDDFDSEDGGWPHDLRKFAAEAWRRFENGLITEEIMYPSDAAHAGLAAR